MMPFNLQEKGVSEIAGFASICSEQKWRKEEFVVSNEPTSVLHMRRSPSPPTSASTLSSSFENPAGVAALPPETPAPAASEPREWASELNPIPTSLGLEDWESMMSESAASPSQEQSLLRWISGDVDDSSFGLKQLLQSGTHHQNNPLEFDGNAGLGIVDQGPNFEQIGAVGGQNLGFSGSGFGSNGKMGSSSSGFVPNNFPPPGLMYQSFEEKPQIMMNQTQVQNQTFFMPLPFTSHQEHHNLLQPQPKRHNPGTGDPNPNPNPQIPKLPFSPHQQNHLGFPQFLPQQKLLQQQPLLVNKQKVMGPGDEMAHALLDQLYKAAEMVGTGNFSHAQAILARLNHQLSPAGKPLHRAAFYFKEALQLLLVNNNVVPNSRTPTPFDVIFKMGAYKVFSEVSPMIQFVNFTCNQALLEALEDADRIHIYDFDIGFGAQWASFMQELPVRSNRGGASSLKITAFASPTTHHPVELVLMRENLNQFANEIGLNFELEVVNFDSLDQSSYSLPMFLSSDNESVAVNFPVWSSSDQPSALPALLRFVKQLSPKILVSLDRGCDRSDLPFPQHILHALQSYIHLLESLDAVNVTSDALNKIERFLLQPRIESTVLGRLRAPEKMPLWKTLFASAGFSPITFSNFTETQAECVVRRTPVRGFHVDKRQASLVLCWQRRELISASAWRC